MIFLVLSQSDGVIIESDHSFESFHSDAFDWTQADHGVLSPNPLYFDCHESGFESIRAQFEFSDSLWPTLNPSAISQSEARIVTIRPIRGLEAGALVSESSRRNICPDGRLPDTNPQTLLSFNYVKTKYLSNATTWKCIVQYS